MTPTIVLPDGDPHMAALLSRPDFAARLDRLGGARLHADLPANDDELIARIGDATVVILGAYLTGPVLRRLPALELISFTGTGAATFVDLPAARDCGIAVANVARYGDAAVAEHALALALALAKNVVGNDRAVRAGEWHVGQGVELAGKTAGIVGYGGIGGRRCKPREPCQRSKDTQRDHRGQACRARAQARAGPARDARGATARDSAQPGQEHPPDGCAVRWYRRVKGESHASDAIRQARVDRPHEAHVRGV